MTRPRKKMKCPDCKSGFIPQRSLLGWGNRREPLELDELLAALPDDHDDLWLTCTWTSHTFECRPSWRDRDLLKKWLRDHDYLVGCEFCRGSGKVHMHRVVERALIKGGE